MNNNKKQDSFPVRLHSMLEQTKTQGLDHIISWLPTGDAFRVHNVKYFEEYILPDYFNTAEYKTFQRNLNWYGFVCLKGGPEEGAYKHELFVRHDPTLCRRMKRPSSSTGSSHRNRQREGGTLRQAQARHNERARKKLRSSLDNSTAHQHNEVGSSKEMKGENWTHSAAESPFYCMVCLSPFSTRDGSIQNPVMAQISIDILCGICQASLKQNPTDVFSWLVLDCGFPVKDLSFILDPLKISSSLSNSRDNLYYHHPEVFNDIKCLFQIPSAARECAKRYS